IYCLLLAPSDRAAQQTTPEGVSWTTQRFSIGGVGSRAAQVAVWWLHFWREPTLSQNLASWRCAALEDAKHVSRTYFPHQRGSSRRRSGPGHHVGTEPGTLALAGHWWGCPGVRAGGPHHHPLYHHLSLSLGA